MPIQLFKEPLRMGRDLLRILGPNDLSDLLGARLVDRLQTLQVLLLFFLGPPLVLWLGNCCLLT